MHGIDPNEIGNFWYTCTNVRVKTLLRMKYININTSCSLSDATVVRFHVTFIGYIFVVVIIENLHAQELIKLS
jgi:hypothetical protein